MSLSLDSDQDQTLTPICSLVTSFNANADPADSAIAITTAVKSFCMLTIVSRSGSMLRDLCLLVAHLALIWHQTLGSGGTASVAASQPNLAVYEQCTWQVCLIARHPWPAPRTKMLSSASSNARSGDRLSRIPHAKL